MDAYHIVSPDQLGSVLANGLKCTSRGVKGSDKSIIKTDTFLDEHCPNTYKQLGISRDNNVYAYVAVDGNIIDIVSGDLIPILEFKNRSEEPLLEMKVDAQKCYVSDLDTYDSLKAAIEKNENLNILELLAKSYWSKLTPLKDFKVNSLRRPEIMVTYDIEPSVMRHIP